MINAKRQPLTLLLVLAAAGGMALSPIAIDSAYAKKQRAYSGKKAKKAGATAPSEKANAGAVAAGQSSLVVANAPIDAAAETDAAKPTPKLLKREEILSADTTRLERIGRHIMIGYHGLSAVKALVERRAIAGVFITDHNVRGRKVEAIRADIDMLQAIRKEQGLPPLVIAADQEGGSVSRLSPPLKRQPALGTLLAKIKTDEERRSIVEAYAVEQAAELARLGVTLNFGPVVDLNLDPKNRSDGETRLRLRAISADPYTVAKVAGWYCDTLAEAGVMCTLKHFPGLGRVRRDTHVASGQIDVTEGTLELNDWVPFRRTMDRPNAVTMMGHVRVGVLDTTAPASYSQTIIDGLVRKAWNYRGLIVTDDFSMGAITRGKPGIGAAAVKSLNAGADLVLVSFSEKHFDTMMSALLAADEAGEIDHAALARSRARLDRILSPLGAEPSN